MIDQFAEIEPFKTAITVYFLREWYYVAYAASWLVLGPVPLQGLSAAMSVPLGAVMAIGGLVAAARLDRPAQRMRLPLPALPGAV